mmetsp:Transcript_5313/g.21729  ORF Transcript_5313/g.21729 Transcript_5313/m.21729 type:complete len:388 (+) Transcript_5313:653-1816(+)
MVRIASSHGTANENERGSTKDTSSSNATHRGFATTPPHTGTNRAGGDDATSFFSRSPPETYQIRAQSATDGVLSARSRRFETHRGRSSSHILACSAAYTSPYASNALTLSGLPTPAFVADSSSPFGTFGKSSNPHIDSHASHLAKTHSCSAHGVAKNSSPSKSTMRSIAALFAAPTAPTAASHLHTRRSSSSSARASPPHPSAAAMRSATTPEFGATRRATIAADMPCVFLSESNAAGSEHRRRSSTAGSDAPDIAARCKGQFPSTFRAHGSAPASRSSRVMARTASRSRSSIGLAPTFSFGCTSSFIMSATMSGVHPLSSATLTQSRIDSGSPSGCSMCSTSGLPPSRRASALIARRLARMASSVARTAETCPLPAAYINGVLPPS